MIPSNGMTLEAAAALYIRTRGRSDANQGEDLGALISLMRLFAVGREITEASFCQTLSAFLPKAKIAPGLQTAWLPDKKLWYIAVHIFPGDSVACRQVMAKATDPDYQTCLDKLYGIWKGIAEAVNPKFFEPTPDAQVT